LRIVSDELFERAQVRARTGVNRDKRLKSGGKAKYLLSGLLKCSECGARCVLANERSEEYRKQIALGLSGDPTRVQSSPEGLRPHQVLI
jgi:hypothetical protein